MKKGYKEDIEALTLANENFRHVLYTGAHSQLVVMALKPREEIGEEVHAESDQFFRFEEGTGRAILNDTTYEIHAGDVLIIPAGTKHNIINLSDLNFLKMYTLYSPAHHKDGVIHATKEAAEADTEHFDGKTTEQE